MKEFIRITFVVVLLILIIDIFVIKNQNFTEDQTHSSLTERAEQSVQDEVSLGIEDITVFEAEEVTEFEAEEVEPEELTLSRVAILEEAEYMFKGYFYEEALELLNSNELLINDETRELEARIIEEKDNLVLFEGQVKHIFFHSLILDPEYLFPDLSIPTGGYNEGFVFQTEFQRMLPLILERGYVLYNINDIFSVGEDGQMEQREIWLPPGRRPLILSIDDPTYHYGIGFANRLFVDENGELKSEVVTPDGEIITNDGDIQLILNDFVREHPEFSWRGHKGIIAATGFMGIFGYDLHTEDSRVEATRVAEALKETGWIFANHSYTHNHGVPSWWSQDADLDNIRLDVRLWKEEIEPIVGQTNILIAPGGVVLPPHAMSVILESGYNIYCSVNPSQSVTIFPDYVLQERIEIGGFSLIHWSDYLTEHFFDVKRVIDSHRPPTLS